MYKSLVLTIIGPDRRGLVERLSETIAAYDGNWVESRMATLAGQFAGLLWVMVPAEQGQPLEQALKSLESEGLRVVVESGEDQTPAPPRSLRLELVGHDRPGIVRDLSRALRLRNINVEELASECYSAPMSGERLFRARVDLGVPGGTDMNELLKALEDLAEQLALDASFEHQTSHES
jgi:glycine cleavage system regulatory protein